MKLENPAACIHVIVYYFVGFWVHESSYLLLFFVREELLIDTDSIRTTSAYNIPSKLPLEAMPESAPAGPKPSSSVKLVLLGEAAVGKVGCICRKGGIFINMV